MTYIRTTSPKLETEQREKPQIGKEEENYKLQVHVTKKINIWSDSTLQTHFF